jgi:hypothetical protein
MVRRELLAAGQLKALQNAAIQGDKSKASIECTYRSISGRRYSSISEYNLEKSEWVITFAELS